MRALKTVGYVISHKNGENRRALFPAQCTQLKFPEQAIFETGYGLSLGFSDADYCEYQPTCCGLSALYQRPAFVEAALCLAYAFPPDMSCYRICATTCTV